MAILGTVLTQLHQWGGPGKTYGPFRPGWGTIVAFSLPITGPNVDFEDLAIMPEVLENDQGIALTVTVVDGSGNPIDISQASNVVLKLLYPDGSTFDFNANFVNTGVDGQIYYSTVAGDLNLSGLYEVQAKVTMLGTTKHTLRGKFYVGDNVGDNVDDN